LLQIDVFLPPNQHATGTLELYHSDYNIAVISVQPRLRCIHPENIFHGEKGRKKVVAIGREVEDGVLMGTIGFVPDKPYDKPRNLDCKDLKLSTCKIKKVRWSKSVTIYNLSTHLLSCRIYLQHYISILFFVLGWDWWSTC
jgi:hypothetical protein